ncbi:MAG: hypothetical protein EBX52_10295, partial [Proteobacteria bacterium]|nr:hypothetical protein [Pseudomonadota bacterium]
MSRLPGIRIAVFLWLLRSASALAFPVAEIRSEGLLPEQWEQAKSVTGLLPGDEYDRLRVERAEGRLREYFDSKGYPQNEVSHEVIQKGESHSIRFNFKLGPVLKLESLAINVRDPVFSRDLELRLMRLLDVKPGEPFDRDRIKDLKHTTESFLSSQSFIDSRVREMTTEVVEGGIRLKLDLDIGERVVFSVQGNSFFSKSELMEQIEAQRNIGLGRDYVSVLMGRISDQYVQRGFRKVRITPYFFEAHGNEPKKVLFDIEEGPRSLIRSVIFDGNEAFSDEELTRLFFQNAEERIRARIYNGKMIETAAASLVDELKKRGYLSAKLIGVKTDELPGGKDVSIRIFINEGLQTRVQAIEFRGNHAIPSESLAKSLGIQEGDPLDLSKLEDGLDRIKRAYRALGYLDFRFSNEGENSESIVSYSEKNQIAYLSLEIDEGSSYSLGGIEIFGNEITR